MFGEVFDASPAFQSIYSTDGEAAGDARLRLPVRPPCASPTAKRHDVPRRTCTPATTTTPTPTRTRTTCRRSSATTTWAGSATSSAASLAKDRFAHALMYTLRGQPVVYYGDEQGFIGDGGDKDARQDMFASQVASYNDDAVIGGTPGAADRFGTNGPVFRAIADLSKLRSSTPGPRRRRPDHAVLQRLGRHLRGEPHRPRRTGRVPGRCEQRRHRQDGNLRRRSPTHGRLPLDLRRRSPARRRPAGQVTVTVPPMSVRVLQADRAIERSHSAPHGVPQRRRRTAACSPVAPRSGRPSRTTSSCRRRSRSGRSGPRRGSRSAPTTTRPYRVFHDVSALAEGFADRVPRGREGQRRASVGHLQLRRRRRRAGTFGWWRRRRRRRPAELRQRARERRTARWVARPIGPPIARRRS